LVKLTDLSSAEIQEIEDRAFDVDEHEQDWDKTLNTVSPAQDKFFQETKESMTKLPFNRWPRTTVDPPDPCCSSSEFSTEAATLKPIDFYSPTDSYAHMGVTTLPCALHGWDHDQYVKLGRWRQRLVKGMFRDRCLAGRQATCSKCKEAHDACKKEILNAGQNTIERVRLKQKLKGLTYTFMTYSPKVSKFLWERHPFVCVKLQAVITHKMAISCDVMDLIARSIRGHQNSHDVEKMLHEFRWEEFPL
jgi:hypothetical protein